MTPESILTMWLSLVCLVGTPALAVVLALLTWLERHPSNAEDES